MPSGVVARVIDDDCRRIACTQVSDNAMLDSRTFIRCTFPPSNCSIATFPGDTSNDRFLVLKALGRTA